jgi:curved DNA-binding protein CbpA
MAERPIPNFYILLGLEPAASVQQIRRAYRELSKLYHPDTTELSPTVATAKFQELNEAYATLSSPERRAAYDLKMGYSRISVIQTPANFDRPVTEAGRSRSSAYPDPTDRPLSAGEIFALFILGITFIACLILVVMIGLTRGEAAFQPLTARNTIQHIDTSPTPPLELSEESAPDPTTSSDSSEKTIDSISIQPPVGELENQPSTSKETLSPVPSDASTPQLVEPIAPPPPE